MRVGNRAAYTTKEDKDTRNEDSTKGVSCPRYSLLSGFVRPSGHKKLAGIIFWRICEAHFLRKRKTMTSLEGHFRICGVLESIWVINLAVCQMLPTRRGDDTQTQHPVTILGINITHWPKLAQFTALCVAVFVFYLAYGYMQELIFRLPGIKPFGWYLTLIQFIVYSGLSVAELKVTTGIVRRIPWKIYLQIAFYTVLHIRVNEEPTGRSLVRPIQFWRKLLGPYAHNDLNLNLDVEVHEPTPSDRDRELQLRIRISNKLKA
ncbi:UAA transporter family domain-containing protein [Ditylenchus destructor]|nr:UAA transporter family domain-containing protein [Ditylenchus destructor]